MPRNDRYDKQKADGVSTDDFGGIFNDFVKRDVGEFGGSDEPDSDASKYVLVRKYTDDGVSYEEQHLINDLMEADEPMPEILAHASGAYRNASDERVAQLDSAQAKESASADKGEAKSPGPAKKGESKGK